MLTSIALFFLFSTTLANAAIVPINGCNIAPTASITAYALPDNTLRLDTGGDYLCDVKQSDTADEFVQTGVLLPRWGPSATTNAPTQGVIASATDENEAFFFIKTSFQVARKDEQFQATGVYRPLGGGAASLTASMPLATYFGTVFVLPGVATTARNVLQLAPSGDFVSLVDDWDPATSVGNRLESMHLVRMPTNSSLMAMNPTVGLETIPVGTDIAVTEALHFGQLAAARVTESALYVVSESGMVFCITFGATVADNPRVSRLFSATFEINTAMLAASIWPAATVLVSANGAVYSENCVASEGAIRTQRVGVDNPSDVGTDVQSGYECGDVYVIQRGNAHASDSWWSFSGVNGAGVSFSLF